MNAAEQSHPPSLTVRMHHWGPCRRVWMRAPTPVDTFELSISSTPEPDENRVSPDRSGNFVVVSPEQVYLFGRTVRDDQRSEWVRAVKISTDR